MKTNWTRSLSTILFLYLSTSLPFYPSTLSASVIEPFRPGVAPAEVRRAEYIFSAGLVAAENLVETPLSVFYGIDDNLQLQVRWGMISNGADIGISDLKFAVKYNFFALDSDPMIFVDAGISLPTADHTKNLGTGGVGISLGWYITKNFEQVKMFLGLAGKFNDAERLEGANPPRVFSYRLGGAYEFDRATTLIGEIKGYNNYWNRTDGFTQELYLAPGIRYDAKIPIKASLLIGLTEPSRSIGVYIETLFGGQ